MLFTDNDVVSSADLARIDSEVVSVGMASKPSILIDGPQSICEQAWGECGRQITAATQMYASYLAAPGQSGGGNAAVLNTGGAAQNQPRARLSQIVATETQYANAASAVQIWVAYMALTLFYRDASARLGKDRLEEKFLRYKDEADFAWRQLRQVGLPYIQQPLEAPAAKHGVASGTWGTANLSTVAGAGTAQTLQVAITYYDGSKYVSEAAKGNAESGPSETLAIAQPVSTVLRVSIASLNPPSVPDQLNPSHWILWVGAPGGLLYFQTAAPIGTKVVTLSGDPVLSGYSVGSGQTPELPLAFQNMAGRG